jgi:hypothetical protein
MRHKTAGNKALPALIKQKKQPRHHINLHPLRTKPTALLSQHLSESRHNILGPATQKATDRPKGDNIPIICQGVSVRRRYFYRIR